MDQKIIEYKLLSESNNFKIKVKHALDIIKNNISTHSYVSWSGGKDSCVVVHLCYTINKNIKIMHIKSGYGLPDGYQFMKDFSFLFKLNYEEIETTIDYIELCKEFGLPHMRSHSIQTKIVNKIKKNPANKWAMENGYNEMFWGIRAEESLKRKALARYKGKIFTDKDNLKRISPILDWNVKEIFAYHHAFNLPVNPIYLKENCGEIRETIRNTGWLSTDGENRGRLEWLRKNYPGQYRKIRELL